MTSNLNKAAQGYGLYNEKNEIIGVLYYMHLPHQIKNIKLLTRLVILPDYQGCGLGTKLTNYVANQLSKEGYYVCGKTSSLAMIMGLKKSPLWICNGFGFSSENSNIKDLNKTVSKNRKTASFRYVGKNKEFLKLKG